MISRRSLLGLIISLYLPARARNMDIEVLGCIIKRDRLYKVDEERKLFQWIKQEGAGLYSIGFMQILSSLIYPLYAIKIKPPGTVVELEGNLAVVESGKRVSTFPSPLSGRIVESNRALEKDPSAIVSRPYDSWIVKLKAEKPEELSKLSKADEIVSTIRNIILKEKIECLPKK